MRTEWVDLGQDALAIVAIALVSAEQRASNASFAFFGFWYFTTVIVTVLAIATYLRARRMGLQDKVQYKTSKSCTPY